VSRRLWLFVSVTLALAGLGGAGWMLSVQRRHDRQWRQDVAVLARAALARRDLGGANQLVHTGLARSPGDPDLLLARGDIARAGGDYNSARTDYLAAAGDDRTAAEARGRLFDMALGIGASEDAAHHLEILEQRLGTEDPQVKQRRERLKIAPAGSHPR